MCIKKVEAWSFDGKTYPTEDAALRAAITKHLGTNAAGNEAMRNADDLVPLLQRVIDNRSGNVAAEVTSENDDKDPEPNAEKLLTGKEIDEDGHAGYCNTRATGYASDCNCGVSA